MADILLTHGYFLLEDEKELQIMKPYPTLGLLYVSAYLRRAGSRSRSSTARSPTGTTCSRGSGRSPTGWSGSTRIS